MLSEPPRRSHYPPLKRAVDAAAAATGLVLLSPLGLAIAALIKLESRGPVHFGHVREGMDGFFGDDIQHLAALVDRVDGSWTGPSCVATRSTGSTPLERP